LAAACLGLGCCMPMGCLGLGCVPMGGCLGLGCCMPWPWLLHAHGGLPRPWLLHALALAAACVGLGCCMPMGCLGLGCVPMGGCLGLGCCMPWPWLVSQKMRVFWKRRLFDPKWQALGMARCPGACPHARRAASPRIVPHSGEIGSCLFPFLCS